MLLLCLAPYIPMKHIPTIAGVLLGLLFLAASLMFLLELGPKPEAPPKGSLAEHFWAAFGPTGYMKFIKICELVGAVLVAIPRTRTIGLLILAPIVANIFAFHVYLTDGSGLTEPMVLAAGSLTVIVLLCELPKLCGLMRGTAGSGSGGAGKKPS